MRFEYRLTGAGWAQGVVSDGSASVTLTASYLSDALGDLLDAVTELLSGATEVRCSWWQEPGESRWIFRESRGASSLQVLQFEETWPDLLPDFKGDVVFEASCTALQMVTAIVDASQAVLDEHGVDAYLRNWVMHAFPFEQLATAREVTSSVEN
ncbi:MAG: hypothetical protein M3Y49_20355 [Actinomycetota bacterium]|nr:hypothetical protein [Actinomycetota bacterium]